MDPNQQPAMPQANTPPPANNPQPMQQPYPATPPAGKTDVLGIVAIITAILGLSPIAFIAGLFGASKAKSEMRSALLSRIGWILGLLGMLAWVAFGVFFVLVIMIAGADNKKFLNAVFEKDYETACTMWGAAEGSDREDCEAFLDTVNSKYSGYKSDGLTSENGESVLKITLTKKSGGTDSGSVKVKNGEVTNFVFGTGTSVEDTSDPAGTVESGTTDSSLVCLSQARVEEIFPYVLVDWDTGDSSDEGKNSFMLDNVFFKADSTAYEYPTVQSETLDKIAKVYLDNTNTNMVYKIRGQVNESSLSAEGSALAQQRYETIYNELVNRGVPASKIYQLTSKNVPDGYGGERNVEVIVVSDCDDSSR